MATNKNFVKERSPDRCLMFDGVREKASKMFPPLMEMFITLYNDLQLQNTFRQAQEISQRNDIHFDSMYKAIHEVTKLD